MIEDNPQTPDDHSFVFGPRAVGLGDGDIEVWCWDMFAANNDFGRISVEIADLCADGSDLSSATMPENVDIFDTGDGSMESAIMG